MKVLHVLGALQASGAEVMLRAAGPELARHSIETVILATGEEEGSFADQLRSAGMHVYHLPFSRSLGFALRFLQQLRRHGPDVVHIHTERANAALGLLARLSGRRRIVRTVHSNFTYQGRLRIVRTLERALLRITGVVHISISPSVQRNERQRLANPTILVENWIAPHLRPPTSEERRDARRAFQVEPPDLVVSSVGRCVELKNHASIVEALPKIELATGRRVVYLHAGSGPTERAERDAAASVQVKGESRFLGVIEDVDRLLWASDIYLMPSSYEGMSIAALEALACGTPAVLGDCEGLRDSAPASEVVRFVGTSADEIASGVGALVGHLEGARPQLAGLAASVRAEHDMSLNVARLVAIYSGRKG